jgi:hypothetical protein
MVEKGIINLIDTFTSHPDILSVKNDDKDDERPAILHYFRNYIQGMPNRESFDFFKWFFGKYDFDDMHRIFVKGPDGYGNRHLDYFFVNVLYKGPATSYGEKNNKDRFNIKRSFLTDDEHREMFGWLDDYMFKYKADKYVEYSALILLDPFIETLFPKTELRKIYDMVRSVDINVVKSNSNESKQKFLTIAELQAEQDAKHKQEQEEKQKLYEQHIKNMKNDLKTSYDGSIKSLLSYVAKHSQEAMSIAAEYLERTLKEKNYILSKDEINLFFQFSEKMLKGKYIDFITIKNYILLIEEETENVENTGTPEFSADS